ncbi:hypothetical protein [Streptomyces sp. WAC01280]|uniref:hypothetical protein n=1 Tax=Streptomyces sp. WAC01280 TaxID=2487424 RepID=UPI000F767994|nr:hypothetical protein [Streptomyces sp. WAC01280]RSS56755.1 hypothetical protein EF909_11765 [Streptomyces sp. WAC01280]
MPPDSEHPWFVLIEDGPVHRLMDLAITAQAEGAPPLQDEVDRFCRLVRDCPQASWSMPLAAVSALLDALADRLTSADSAPPPDRVMERLSLAAGGQPPAELLRRLSRYTRDQDEVPSPTLDELPMVSWEAWIRFAALEGVTPFFEALDLSPQEAVKEAARAEHPYECHTRTATLAAQIQLALLSFRTPEELDASLGEFIPWVNHDVLRELLRAVVDHFAEEH